MRFVARSIGVFLLAAGLPFALVSPVMAQNTAQPEGFDPLALESAPIEKIEIDGKAKVFVEGALGQARRRYQLDGQDYRRLSFDFAYSGNIGGGARAVLSDRLDYSYSTVGGSDATINSLREAYLSWQPGGGNIVLDVGRINMRNGPGYGYNPTDFFRDGSLRLLTSADPFALRQNRLGTVMLRGQRLWDGGSLSLVYSPKLATRPSADGWSLDLGSTNNRGRGMIAVGTRWSEKINTQFLLYKEIGQSATLGANLTALLSDAATAHLEWTVGKELDLLSRALPGPSVMKTRNRFVGGMTYTTLLKTSITFEYQYNGFGLNKSGISALAGVPGGQLTYFGEALRLQELAPRQAYLIYVTQKDLWLKDLDLTAYLRVNPGDNSQLAWIELRHHWPKFDLTFQLQQNIGRQGSEFGIVPERRVMQILGTYYF